MSQKMYPRGMSEALVKDHHKTRGGPYRCQVESFNEFGTKLLPHVVQELGTITAKAGDDEHTLTLSNVTWGAPEHRDPNGTTCHVTPHTARERGLTYEAPVYVQVQHVLKRGDEERRTCYENQLLTYMPVMLGSIFAEPDAAAGAGYFIVLGHPKCVISQVGLCPNTFFVFPSKHNSRYACSGEIRSVHYTKLRSTSTLTFFVPKGGSAFNVFFELPFLKMDVPMVAVFRLLGIESKADMTRLIFTGGAEVPLAMQRLLNMAFNHPASLMTIDELRKWLATSSGSNLEGAVKAAGVDTDPHEFYTERLFANELLPHLGCSDSPETKQKKAAYLGLIVRRIIAVYTKAEPADYRDAESNKRVIMVGTLLARLCRQLIRRFVKTLHTIIVRTLSSGNKVLNVRAIMSSKSISPDIKYAFSSGVFSGHHSGGGTQAGITQLLTCMNRTALLAALEKVNTPMPKEGKYVQVRQLDVEQYGVFCPDETPEGATCGLQRNLAMFAYVRTGLAEDVLAHDVLLNLPGIQPWMPGDSPPFLLVNGAIVGKVTKPADQVAAELRELRRDGVLPRYMSVSTTLHEGVIVTCDGGCVLRPLIVLSRLHLLPELKTFQQCVDAGVIEYVGKLEEASFLVADTMERVATSPDYTHVDVHPMGILGRCASLIPNSDRNQGPRNMFQCNMGKQAVDVPSLDFLKRTDVPMHVPYYSQKPIARTLVDESSAGCNVVVAILAGLYNQEDSVILNQGAVDRGLFRNTYYSTYADKCSPVDGENFENPALASNCVHLQMGNFEHLDVDGLPIIDAKLEKGDVVIGKTLTRVDVEDSSKRKSILAAAAHTRVRLDHSTHTKAGGIVDRVSLTNHNGQLMTRVRLRETRIPEVGDKLASRAGQKGTIGLIIPQQDMPFVAYGSMAGVSPDLIMSPHAIPSRMTIGHCVESVQGMLGALLGTFMDATPFQADAKDAVNRMCDALHANGFQRYGHTRMMCGKTGEMLDAEVFLGINFYQRLKHNVGDKLHARTRGQVNYMTRQPLEGRAREGGHRVGEMERDAMVAHGASAIIQDRLFQDAFEVPVCKKCEFIAESAHDTTFGATAKGKEPYCRACNSYDVDVAHMPYVTKLVIQELYATGIKMRLSVNAGIVEIK